MKGKTSIDMNLVVFCAKIQLVLKNLKSIEKTLKFTLFFEVFHTFFKFIQILAQNNPKILFMEVFRAFDTPLTIEPG